MAKVFRLPVYERGVLKKELVNDTGKIPFGVVEEFASKIDIIDAVDKNPVIAAQELRDLIGPVCFEMFADYETDDLRGVDLADLVAFFQDFTDYMYESFGLKPADSAPRNLPQGVAPKKPTKKH
jgi:hypothetical protein